MNGITLLWGLSNAYSVNCYKNVKSVEMSFQ